jgi:hypothetical protein
MDGDDEGKTLLKAGVEWREGGGMSCSSWSWGRETDAKEANEGDDREWGTDGLVFDELEPELLAWLCDDAEDDDDDDDDDESLWNLRGEVNGILECLLGDVFVMFESLGLAGLRWSRLNDDGFGGLVSFKPWGGRGREEVEEKYDGCCCCCRRRLIGESESSPFIDDPEVWVGERWWCCGSCGLWLWMPSKCDCVCSSYELWSWSSVWKSAADEHVVDRLSSKAKEEVENPGAW